MDTTWRDAHQSLLATRVRTTDLLTIGMSPLCLRLFVVKLALIPIVGW